MSETIKIHTPPTFCCDRTLWDESGVWEHEPHVWAVHSVSWPLCCGPRTAEWVRQVCTCLAIRWIEREQLPAGTYLSTASNVE